MGDEACSQKSITNISIKKTNNSGVYRKLVLKASWSQKKQKIQQSRFRDGNTQLML